ncbi:hypothetical protein BDZ85DRAFT_191940 [Elsinoe ampelina]|uniref:DUF7582 domain-containing protein n=1 Tax=Elsinoe ampelina TaxID=302913 RepID=A0A6A6GN22_9PEZI|nr:hypothetical protein BDZ85DRAFT_191940 [Elsinoe ampelina]
MQISGPSGGPVLVPAPQRDLQGRPIRHTEHDVSGERLKMALAVVADFLAQKNFEVTLYTCGGAVNTIHLQSRASTADVDFFLPNMPPNIASTIEAAATHAIARMSVPLSDDWLNNTQTLMIPRRIQAMIAEEARQQNTIVFQKRGLTVLAVPWSYALMAKIDRMSNPNKTKAYDPIDAAVYLRQHIQIHGGHPVDVQQLNHWQRRYETRGGREQIRAVSRAYLERYREPGIVE